MTTASRTGYSYGSDTISIPDGVRLNVGTGNDLALTHNGTNSLITSTTGDLIINNTLVTGSTIIRLGTNNSATDFQVQNNLGTAIFTIGGNQYVSMPDNTTLAIGGIGTDFTIVHNGINTTMTSATGDLIVDNTLGTGSTIMRLGTNTSATDFQVQNNSETALLTVDGAGTIIVPLANPIQHGSSTFLVPCYGSAIPQEINADGAITLTESLTRLTSVAGTGITFTLAAPGSAVPPGFIKNIVMIADGADATLTVTGLPAGEDVIVFSEIGQSYTLMAVSATVWTVVNVSPGDTTVQSMAAFS